MGSVNNQYDCPFCAVQSGQNVVFETADCLAVFDQFPVSPGHLLVIPKRHVAFYFDLKPEEQRHLWEAVNHCKKLMDERFHPDGYNVGINVSEAAGQSIPHVHIHLIPRYVGDVPNPRGGVRGVIPGKQNYGSSGDI